MAGPVLLFDAITKAYNLAKTPRECGYRPTAEELFSFTSWVGRSAYDFGPVSLEKIARNVPKYRDHAIFILHNPRLIPLFYALDGEMLRFIADIGETRRY